MNLSGEQRINAPREAVWNALNDAEILRTCIPGCESLDKVSDTEFTATVKASVGPVKARFKGQVSLENLDPPNGYTLKGEGKGGAAGFAKGGADVQLSTDGDDTVLTYSVKANVGGQLARIGGRLIDATAKKLSDEFFSNLQKTFIEKEETAVAEESPKIAETGAQETESTKKGLHPIIWGSALVAAALLFLWYISN